MIMIGLLEFGRKQSGQSEFVMRLKLWLQILSEMGTCPKTVLISEISPWISYCNLGTDIACEM